MDEKKELERVEEPEESFGFETNFENDFDDIGRDIEIGCNELTQTLDNLGF